MSRKQENNKHSCYFCVQTSYFLRCSKDPMLALPVEARNLICSHFSVYHLLELSTVSSSWYFGIEGLETFKKRVWIKISNTDQLEFLTTARDYENLEVVSEVWNWNVDYEILTKSKWKHVNLFVEKFPSSNHFVQCLKLFSKTAETLKLKKIKEAGVESDYVFEDFLEFPCLKSLHVVECSSAVLQPFINQTTLKTLKLDFILPSSTNAKLELILTELAVTFVNLVELEVNQSAINLFAFNIAPHVKFHLKTFVVSYPYSEIAVENVKKFIISQGKSLENIKLLSWDDPSTLYQIWNSTSELKTFYQSDGTSNLNFENFDPKMTISVNENFRRFHFHFTSLIFPLNWLEPLILASPFLEEIQVPKWRSDSTSLSPNSNCIKMKTCFFSCDDNDNDEESEE